MSAAHQKGCGFECPPLSAQQGVLWASHGHNEPPTDTYSLKIPISPTNTFPPSVTLEEKLLPKDSSSLDGSGNEYTQQEQQLSDRGIGVSVRPSAHRRCTAWRETDVPPHRERRETPCSVEERLKSYCRHAGNKSYASHVSPSGRRGLGGGKLAKRERIFSVFGGGARAHTHTDKYTLKFPNAIIYK